MFVNRIIEITAFIEEVEGTCQCKDSVSKSGRDVNLILFFCRESNTRPFPELRRADSYIDRNVQSFPFHRSAQLGLRMPQLVVQSPQCSLARTRMIVLNEMIYDAKVSKFCLVVCFQEESTFILEYPGAYL